MSREIRRVPEDWKHPKGKSLLGPSFEDDLADWGEGHAKWRAGLKRDYATYPEKAWKPREDSDTGSYSEWAGPRPTQGEYMPTWEDEATHYQMYETTSEGSPISPVFATPEEVARWCADNNASSFAGMTAPYEQWLRVARGGYAPSAVIGPETGGKLVSGVEGIAGDETS